MALLAAIGGSVQDGPLAIVFVAGAIGTLVLLVGTLVWALFRMIRWWDAE